MVCRSLQGMARAPGRIRHPEQRERSGDVVRARLRREQFYSGDIVAALVKRREGFRTSLHPEDEEPSEGRTTTARGGRRLSARSPASSA